MHAEVGVSWVGFNVFEGIEFAEVDVIVVETENLGVVVGACVELSHFS